MGKGDKKSRRGKIVIGSSGVRRQKPSKRKGFVKAETTPVAPVKKVAKVTEKVIAEVKPKAKVAETIDIAEPENIVADVKPVKKAVKKAKVENVPE